MPGRRVILADKDDILRPRRVLAFDSGLGGLTVLAPLAAMRPDLDLTYLADDAAFPYGRLADDALVARVEAVIGAAIARFEPDLVLIACNTASTLALAPLRARFPSMPFVGTVPAIKPAAAVSRSKRISVLATMATVTRDYTRQLVATHAAGCDVALVGAPILAEQAERHVRGLPLDEALIKRETAPAFVDADGRRTDQIVLACTHYPLLLDVLTRLAPWPVTFVDPGPAIARRVDSLLARGEGAGGRRLALTGEAALEPALARHLAAMGLGAPPLRLRVESVVA